MKHSKRKLHLMFLFMLITVLSQMLTASAGSVTDIQTYAPNAWFYDGYLSWDTNGVYFHEAYATTTTEKLFGQDITDIDSIGWIAAPGSDFCNMLNTYMPDYGDNVYGKHIDLTSSTPNSYAMVGYDSAPIANQQFVYIFMHATDGVWYYYSLFIYRPFMSFGLDGDGGGSCQW